MVSYKCITCTLDIIHNTCTLDKYVSCIWMISHIFPILESLKEWLLILILNYLCFSFKIRSNYAATEMDILLTHKLKKIYPKSNSLNGNWRRQNLIKNLNLVLRFLKYVKDRNKSKKINLLKF